MHLPQNGTIGFHPQLYVTNGQLPPLNHLRFGSTSFLPCLSAVRERGVAHFPLDQAIKVRVVSGQQLPKRRRAAVHLARHIFHFLGGSLLQTQGGSLKARVSFWLAFFNPNLVPEDTSPNESRNGHACLLLFLQKNGADPRFRQGLSSRLLLFT